MYTRMTIGDFLGDFVVYRNLEPADRRLRGLQQIWRDIGLPAYRVPRKAEPDYAAAMVNFLKQAQALRGAIDSLAHLIYIGDTRFLDGTAYRNLKAQGAWPGWAFIASEKCDAAPQVEIEEEMYLSNRWQALSDFLDYVQGQGIPLDGTTTAVVDLDKTVLGARGRNDGVIDMARVAGVRRTAEEVLGERFAEAAFRAVYDRLHQPAYHFFTGDNQDYLAYISLMVSGGVYGVEELWADLETGRLNDFNSFITACAGRLSDRHGGLTQVHREVYGNWQAGDPTPFKSFRYREYQETIARMDVLPDEASREEVLRREIVITGEVVEAVRYLQGRGVLCFGLSDKPDEASLPTPELAAQGWKALHRTPMKVIGS
jgi:hypothetical protein